MGAEEKGKDLKAPAWILSELKECMQCGTCSSVCSVAEFSDACGPRRILAYELAGEHEKAMNSDFLWLCTSCQACTDNCPKKLHVSLIIGAIKQCALDLDIAPSGDAAVRMIRNFAKIVEKGGRLSEFELMRKVMGLHVGEIIDNIPVALKLLSHKRLRLESKSIENPGEMAKMFEKMEEQDGR